MSNTVLPPSLLSYGQLPSNYNPINSHLSHFLPLSAFQDRVLLTVLYRITIVIYQIIFIVLYRIVIYRTVFYRIVIVLYKLVLYRIVIVIYRIILIVLYRIVIYYPVFYQIVIVIYRIVLCRIVIVIYRTVLYRLIIMIYRIIIVVLYYQDHLLTHFLLSSIHHVTRIDFTYHSHLHFSIYQWIISLILLLKLLISSIGLECFCLFSRCDSPTCLGLQSFLAILNKSFPSWYVSTNTLSSSEIRNKLSCYRSLIHGLSFQSMSPSHFTPTSFPSFPIATLWLFSIFNSQPFSLFTTDNISLSQDTHSFIPFNQPLL